MRSIRLGSPWRRRRRWPLALISLLIFAAVAAVRAFDVPPPVAGHAEIVDGDTLRIERVRVRLVGIDAPERDQFCKTADGADWPCGKEARQFLVRAVVGRAVSCVPTGRDVYGRTLAHCRVADADLGRTIVAAGWAVTRVDYAADEAAAQSQHIGIWQGDFDNPADWRRNRGGDPSLWESIRNWFG